MVNLITQIARMDAGAQQTVAAAKAENAKKDAALTLEVKEMEEQLLARAEKRLDAVRETEEERVDRELARIRELHADRTNRLEVLYESNHQNWENEILGRVTAF
ncbi:MAG: hypothetical protein E7486_04065 [Ruminococcaceae bacterium]|nr:hypothetical protein [Oscillospiraceae bacterium]